MNVSLNSKSILGEYVRGEKNERGGKRVGELYKRKLKIK